MVFSVLFSASCCQHDLRLDAESNTVLADAFGGYFVARYKISPTQTTSLNGISWPVFPIDDPRPDPVFIYRVSEAFHFDYAWRIGLTTDGELFVALRGDSSCPEHSSALSVVQNGSLQPMEDGTWRFVCDVCK